MHSASNTIHGSDVPRSIISDASFSQPTSNHQCLERITLWPDCRSDHLVRRAVALNQRAQENRFDALHLHSETAKQ